MRYCRENNLPHLADHLLGFLKRDHTATEGLFRVSPSGANVIALKKQFDTGKLVDISEVSPHDAGGVLKLYYRQLPVSIIPKSFYQDAMAPTRCKHVLSEDEYLVQLRAVFDRLKRDRPDHWYLLQRLMDLLHCCAENCEVNKMTRKNLAVVQVCCARE
jgi:RhoGAP domain